MFCPKEDRSPNRRIRTVKFSEKRTMTVPRSLHARTRNHFRTIADSLSACDSPDIGFKNFEISENFRLMTTMVIRSTFCYV